MIVTIIIIIVIKTNNINDSSSRTQRQGTLTLMIVPSWKKGTSTFEGFHSTFAALFSYRGVLFVRVRVPLCAPQVNGATRSFHASVRHRSYRPTALRARPLGSRRGLAGAAATTTTTTTTNNTTATTTTTTYYYYYYYYK